MSERSVAIVILMILLVGLLSMVGMWGPIMMGVGGMMGGAGMMMGRWGYPYGMGWGFAFVSMLIPLLFIILIVAGAYFLLGGRRTEPAESDKAVSILNERYAKGEITKEQYLEMKEHLAKK